MYNSEMQERIKAVKAKIEILISDGRLDEAKVALDQYNAKMPGDPDICSMRSVVAIMEGSLDKAESIIEEGLRNDSIQFDLLYNLAYIKELQGLNQEAADLYRKAETVADSDEKAGNVNKSLEKLKSIDADILVNDKVKIVFFVKEGMDSFLGDITNGLSIDYWVRKIIVSEYGQIDAGMKWADICWFEWCDELVAFGSSSPLASEKIIICRLHGYEHIPGNIDKIYWNNINKLIIDSTRSKQLLASDFPDIFNKVGITVIKSEINVNRFLFKSRTNGYNLAAACDISTGNNPILLLQIIYRLVQFNKSYKLYISGRFQEQNIQKYWNYQVSRMGLENNVFFDGLQEDTDAWLDDKSYFISAKINEGFDYFIAEVMARGLKPVILDNIDSNNSWDEKYLFNTVDEAVDMVISPDYDSKQYRDYIRDNYSIDVHTLKVKELISSLYSRYISGKETKQPIDESIESGSIKRIIDLKLGEIDSKLERTSEHFGNNAGSDPVESNISYAVACQKRDNIFEAALYYAYINKTAGLCVNNYMQSDVELQKVYSFINSSTNDTFIFLSSGCTLGCCNLSNILKLASELAKNVLLLNIKVNEKNDYKINEADKMVSPKKYTNNVQNIGNVTIYTPVCIIYNNEILYENITDLLSYLIKEYSGETNIKLVYEEDLLPVIEIKLRNKFKTIHQATCEKNFSLSYYYEFKKEYERQYDINILDALNKSSKLFSIVIPTRNSAQYLKYTLLSCMNQNFDDYEIIVSDNSTPGNNDTLDLVKSINSEKIRYIRTPSELTLVKNFEYAYLKSEGEYLFSLGSDDALLLHSLCYLNKIIKQYPEEDVIQWGKTFYRWPGYPENPDMFYIPYIPKDNDIPCAYYSSRSLAKQIMNYETDMFALPLIYLNSAMHRRRIRQILATTGRFLDGGSQDIYTGFINLALSEKILITSIPFVIAAASVNSVGYNAHYKDIYKKGTNTVQDDNTRLYLEQPSTFYSKYCRSLENNNDTLRVTEFIKVVDKEITNWDLEMINWKKYYAGCANSISCEDPGFKDKMSTIHRNIRLHNDSELEKWFMENYIQNTGYIGAKYSTAGSRNYIKGFLKDNDGLVLDMSRFGIDNVYDAARFFRNLFNI